MKKTIILLVMPIVFTGSLYAQQITGIAIFSKIGYSSISGSACTLNTIVPSSMGFSNTFITGGAEGYYRTNKVILALDGSIGLQNDKLTTVEWTGVCAGSAYGRLGWIIAEKKHYWIYPSIGFGVAGIDISTHNYATDELASLKNKSLLSPSFDLGFNTDFIMRRVPDAEDFGTMLFGLRIGYRASIKSQRWRDNNDNKLSNMPSFKRNEFYVMLTIGSGVFIKN